MNKYEALDSFYVLANYLKMIGKVRDLDRYKKDFSAFLLHSDRLKAYNFIAPYCKDKKILDIGCFIGYGEKCVAPYAKEIIAIDSDDRVIEFACQNNFAPNVKFNKSDAKKLQFSNRSFDIVIAFQLIEHIPLADVYGFLCGVKKILKENGILFVVTPNRKFRLRAFQRPFNLEHYQEFTAKGLTKVLRKNFKNFEIKGIRAKKWIEEIERKRVRKSAYEVYIFNPLFKFLNTLLPVRIKNLFKKIKSQAVKSSKSESIISADGEKFISLFEKFSIDDFYLVKQKDLIDKSLDLFAICKK
jgi:2-polyprenyl-3-methyl-5-hydroxy-6-metoxy-1,4-benzoquinol methylase